MTNTIADLALLLFVKKLEEDDEKYVWDRHLLSFKIEYSERIAIADEEREQALLIVSDLFSHRMIDNEEFDALYVALSLSVANSATLHIFEEKEF